MLPLCRCLIQTAGGYNTVQMRVQTQIAAPRMQHGNHARLCAEPPLVTGDFIDGFPNGFEQKIVKQAVVGEYQRIEFVRQSKDDMQIRHGQQFGFARLDPLLFFECLTLRAVPIAAGVVMHMYAAAVRTDPRVPAQDGGATLGHRIQDLEMQRRRFKTLSVRIAEASKYVTQRLHGRSRGC